MKPVPVDCGVSVSCSDITNGAKAKVVGYSNFLAGLLNPMWVLSNMQVFMDRAMVDVLIFSVLGFMAMLMITMLMITPSRLMSGVYGGRENTTTNYAGYFASDVRVTGAVYTDSPSTKGVI